MKRRRYAGGDAVENNPNTQKYNAATPHRRLPISFPTDIMRQCRMDFPVFMRFSLCSFHSLISFAYFIYALSNLCLFEFLNFRSGSGKSWNRRYTSYFISHTSYLIPPPALRKSSKMQHPASGLLQQKAVYQAVSPLPGHTVA